jgi:RNA polymerase sigma-70 factor (ECF subfamily)
LAISILKDHPAAEDVLQDAWIKVYTNIHTFKGNAKFATWLYRIVVNIGLTSLKRNRKKAPLESSLEEPPWEATPTRDSLTVLDQQKFIQAAFGRIKEEEALLLRLFYLCELDTAEIRKVTGFSASKIRVGLHRGRNNMYIQLKRLLGKDLINMI